MFGLHESTQTLEVMKEGMSKSLETLGEIGDKVQEAAVRAGYGPTIRADAVKKLVDCVVGFQERSLQHHRRDARACRPRTRPRSATRSRTASAAIAKLVAEGKALGDQWLTQPARRPAPRRRRRSRRSSTTSCSPWTWSTRCAIRSASSRASSTRTGREAELIERLREIYREPGHRRARPRSSTRA